MSMKNSSDIIGNLTCDLPTCSAVPQPTALQCAPASTTDTGNRKAVMINLVCNKYTSKWLYKQGQHENFKTMVVKETASYYRC